MRRLMALVLASCLVLSALTAQAGEFNPVLNIGDAAPAWKELPGTDGKQHALADLHGAEAVVVAFTCNSCPYAVDYEDRINDLTKKYASEGRVAVVAINVNTIEADRLPAMKQRAEEKGFQFPYLYDESQQIAKAFGASRTPEFFVLNQQRQVVYMGAMDDSPQADNVQERYVEQAVASVLQGKPIPKAETPPVGCRIRLTRQR